MLLSVKLLFLMFDLHDFIMLTNNLIISLQSASIDKYEALSM